VFTVNNSMRVFLVL